jgi:hypothetical protein
MTLADIEHRQFFLDALKNKIKLTVVNAGRAREQQIDDLPTTVGTDSTMSRGS